MDPHHYSRIAMAGWVLAAVLLGSAYELHAPDWVKLYNLTVKGNATFGLALLGIVVGVGAPPAVGFLLERIASMLLMIFKRNLWLYKSVKTFGDQPVDDSEGNTGSRKSTQGAAAFHMAFYTFAGSEVLEWARRRRTNMYGSWTSFLAIVGGLIVVRIRYHAFPD